MAEQNTTLRGGFVAGGIPTRVADRVCGTCGWDDLWTIPGYRVTSEGVTFLGTVERCARCRVRSS